MFEFIKSFFESGKNNEYSLAEELRRKVDDLNNKKHQAQLQKLEKEKRFAEKNLAKDIRLAREWCSSRAFKGENIARILTNNIPYYILSNIERHVVISDLNIDHIANVLKADGFKVTVNVYSDRDDKTQFLIVEW